MKRPFFKTKTVVDPKLKRRSTYSLRNALDLPRYGTSTILFSPPPHMHPANSNAPTVHTTRFLILQLLALTSSLILFPSSSWHDSSEIGRQINGKLSSAEPGERVGELDLLRVKCLDANFGTIICERRLLAVDYLWCSD